MKVGLKISFSGFFICVLSLLLIINACDKDEDLSPLPEKLVFWLHENFYKDSTNIVVKIRSKEDYPCLNFEIIYSSSYANDVKVIAFEGITNHGLCHTANGPAKATVNIANGQDTGNYRIDFLFHDKVDSFLFSIDESTVKLELLEKHSGNISYNFSKMFRLCENTYWGYTSKKSENVPDSRHNEFINNVNLIGGQEVILEDGYYGFFVVENNNIDYFDNMEMEEINAFIMHFEDCIEDICEVAQMFEDDLSIFIRNTRGEECEIL